MPSPESRVASRESLPRRVIAVIRRIAGMPDYDAYVRHVRTCHPGRGIPTERQFFDEYLKARYEGGPTRCC